MSSLEGYTKKNDKNINLYERIIKIWNNIPLFIKFFLIMTFIFYFLNLFTNNIAFFLSNIPYYTITKYQFWRLITTIFISTNFFKIIIGLICWVKYASSLETSMGTIKYMTIFILNTFFIQIIFCIFDYSIMYFFNKNIHFLLNKNTLKGTNNMSIWGNIICELTLLCLSNPESPNKLLFIPIVIKAKFYPFLLFGVYTIVNSFKFDLEIISGIIYAYIYFYFLKNYLKISDNFAQMIEDRFCCKKISEINSFISVSNINNGNPFSIMNITVNQIKVGNKNKDNDMEELNIKKGATIHGTFGYGKDEYTKFQGNE